LGLSFIHLGFLAAGAAVAVPILIHLLFRQRPRKVEIGTLQFLRVVLRDHARRRRIRRWILLALRVAGVLLLALLFARPYWNAPEGLGSEREAVLLIDRSASMAAGSAGATPFDKAQAEAGQILKNLPAGAAAHLAYFDADGAAPEKEARINSAARPGLAGTDYTKALSWARDIIVGSRRRSRRVFLWTDLQQCGLSTPAPERFPATCGVEIIDVGRPLAKNLAVEAVEAERTDLREGQPVTVAARCFNAGLFPARDVRMRLSLEGMAPIEKTASLAGRSRQLVRFEPPIKKPGLYHGFVEVGPGDDLPFDDKRFLAFEARVPDQVLLLDGEPGSSVFGNETYYLETALRLRLPGDESKATPTPFVPVRQAFNGQGGSLPDLGPFRVVALCNVADVSPDAANELARFVTAGGSVIILSGEHVKSGAYAALEAAKVLPARIEGPAATGTYRFADWIKDHPIFGPFSDPQYGDLRTFKFSKVTRLVSEPEARVLATGQDGAPLVVERALGQGRCVLFAFPADNAWGEWAIHRLYVPLAHQLVGYLTNRLPETSRVRAQPAGQGSGEAPGVVVENGGALVKNVDPRESEIERTTAEKLREFYSLPEGQSTKQDDENAAETLAAGGERPDELWRTVAWTLLVVLVIETLVANRTYA
jgi:hypothetical protein